MPPNWSQMGVRSYIIWSLQGNRLHNFLLIQLAMVSGTRTPSSRVSGRNRKQNLVARLCPPRRTIHPYTPRCHPSQTSLLPSNIWWSEKTFSMPDAKSCSLRIITNSQLTPSFPAVGSHRCSRRTTTTGLTVSYCIIWRWRPSALITSADGGGTGPAPALVRQSRGILRLGCLA